MSNPTQYRIKSYIESKEKDRNNIDKLFSIAFQSLDMMIQCYNELDKIATKFLKESILEKENQEYQSLITYLVINAPVTRNLYGNNYEEALMDEIDEFCHLYFLKKREMAIMLPDLYAIYNRARGTLVSPEELRNACELLNNKGKYVGLMNINKSLIIHERDFTLENFQNTVLNVLKSAQKISSFTIAQHYGVQYAIVKSLMDQLEQNELICRDESEEGIMYYENLFNTQYLQYIK
ncbi:vacuolar protein-sorting-associated protein, putative [Entamoeba dispar SAW760]|uniref:Vacuolar protein-sorting-associated protein 36 n=1 Tax=Entamoeba dispar (strain ATCC PRA-260 / SAW760) TaxID=370354 RepID=B0ERK5_ENTDS|nr:vacuolar protein-sorting-associated protein, putative [Entamoeba dispar SAW760]EDR22863.1 vacuolar protein-sorting-associated protein, putative [Entamoeba dispar SAW760]|eukprot:EDR22863.1 vacuolar protein-sorting-associated protein, putative [Entamoeba dispar SAW760]